MKPKKSNPFRSSAARLSLPFASALLALFTAPSAMAAVRYWDPLSSGGFGSVDGTITWATSTNLIWTASNDGSTTRLANYVTTTSDDLHFGGPTASLGAGTVPVGTVSAGTISFNTLSGSMLLSGGIITMKAAATITTANSAQAHTISSEITGAATSLTKAGAGTLVLSGVNTYTGQTIITAGTLRLTNSNALGTIPGTNGTGGITINSGTVLQSATTGANPSTTIAAPITLVAGGNATLNIGQGAGSNTHTFNINGAIGGATTNLVYTTGTGSFNNGSSQFIIGAAGTYTGNTLITTGNGGNNPVILRNGVVNALPVTTVLTFDQVAGGGSGRAFTYNLDGNSQTLAGLDNGGLVPQVRNMTVTSTAAAELTINNTADFTFGGSTVSTTIGTVGSTTRAQITGAISLTKSGSGTFTLGGTLAGGATALGNNFTGTTKVLGGILVLGETLSIQSSAFDTAGSIVGDSANGLRTTVTTLRLGGLTGNKDFADVFTDTTGGYGGLTALTLNPGTGVTNSYSGDIGNGAGAMTLTKSGLGTQVLTGANTHAATTIANNGGTLRITTATALGAGAVTISTAGTNTGTLELALTGTNTISNTFNGFSSANALTNGSPGVAQILNTSGTNKITSALTITGTGGNGLNVVSDGGLLELSGTITTNVAAGSRFLSVGGSGDGLVSGAINNGTGLSVIKSGSGTWTLAGVSTYLGNTTVTDGTLDLTSTGGLTFAIGLSEINNKITGTTSGNVNLDGSFTFDLTAAGTGPADFWNIVDLANLSGSSGFTDNFNVVDFTDNGGGIWSKDNGGTIYQFSQGTGLLTVIPEPSAALLGALGALLLLRRRR
jgi:autotransporter-associated beta strand protein